MAPSMSATVMETTASSNSGPMVDFSFSGEARERMPASLTCRTPLRSTGVGCTSLIVVTGVYKSLIAKATILLNGEAHHLRDCRISRLAATVSHLSYKWD